MTLLTGLDRKKVQEVCSQHQLDIEEFRIYSEWNWRYEAFELSHSSRYQEALFFELKVKKGTVTYTFVSNNGDIDFFLYELEKKFGTHSSVTPQEKELLSKKGTQDPSYSLSLLASHSAEAWISILSNLAKGLTLALGELYSPRIGFHVKRQKFLVTTDLEVDFTESEENGAELRLSWRNVEKGETQYYTEEFASYDPKQLLEKIQKEDLLITTIRNSVYSCNPWPCPHGEIPIHWSSKSVAKLLMQFLRGFEGDLFFQEKSFFSKTQLPLEFTFDLLDEPQEQDSCFDCLGAERKKLILLQEGIPKHLALDLDYSKLLHLDSTGRARRTNWDSPTAITLWRPHLIPKRRVASLLKGMDFGLSILDIDVVDLSLQTGEVVFEVKLSRLVHQGEEGEWVKPFTLSYNLISLLKKWEVFSEVEEKLALPIQKKNQRFLIEITTPSAQSNTIFLPGSVPIENYWEQSTLTA